MTQQYNIIIPLEEIEIQAIRSQGAGGQNVNKVSTAIHLRFDIRASSLSDIIKEKLLKITDQHISKDGIIIIKAQKFRTQEKNKEDALNRLNGLIQIYLAEDKPRRATKPTKGSKERRLQSKSKQGQLKSSRKKIDET